MTSEQIRSLETLTLRMVVNGMLGAMGQKWANDPTSRHIAVGELRIRARLAGRG